MAVNHTRKEDVAWFYASVFAMPMLVLGFGVFMTCKRRGAKKATRPPSVQPTSVPPEAPPAAPASRGVAP